MKNELLTLSELCTILKVSRKHVYRLRGQGLPTFMLSKNGRPRFDLDEVKQWMRENAERSFSKDSAK